MNNHVLIVEDDEMVQKFVALHLRGEGYRTSTAITGAEALSILGREAIDLILLDLNLPDGDGLSIAQKVRETSSVPIIILTARKGLEDRLMGLGLGADEYLTKPVDPQELALRVRNLLGRAGGDAVRPPPPSSPQPPRPQPPSAAAPPKRRGFGVIVAVTALIAVFAGGAFWYFGLGTEPPGAQAPGLSAPVKVPAPKPQPKPASPAEAMAPVDLPEEGQTKSIAEVLGYGWVLNTTCDPIPDIAWWKYKSHETVAGYVYRKHKGDWAPYIKIWYVRLVKLQDISERNSSAVTSSGVVLKGAALTAYIGKMQKRLAVIRCLAGEAKAFAAGQ